MRCRHWDLWDKQLLYLFVAVERCWRNFLPEPENQNGTAD